MDGPSIHAMQDRSSVAFLQVNLLVAPTYRGGASYLANSVFLLTHVEVQLPVTRPREGTSPEWLGGMVGELTGTPRFIDN